MKRRKFIMLTGFGLTGLIGLERLTKIMAKSPNLTSEEYICTASVSDQEYICAVSVLNQIETISYNCSSSFNCTDFHCLSGYSCGSSNSNVNCNGVDPNSYNFSCKNFQCNSSFNCNDVECTQGS